MKVRKIRSATHRSDMWDNEVLDSNFNMFLMSFPNEELTRNFISFMPPKTLNNLHTEDETDPYRIPTKHNIRMALRWLVQGVQSGDSLVFHFSGHGSRQRNYNMDEIDGFDETICPVDQETEGTIVDDEINATLVRPLPHGAKLHAIVDACHSGTILDLPFVCRMNRSDTFLTASNSLFWLVNHPLPPSIRSQ